MPGIWDFMRLTPPTTEIRNGRLGLRVVTIHSLRLSNIAQYNGFPEDLFTECVNELFGAMMETVGERESCVIKITHPALRYHGSSFYIHVTDRNMDHGALVLDYIHQWQQSDSEVGLDDHLSFQFIISSTPTEH